MKTISNIPTGTRCPFWTAPAERSGDGALSEARIGDRCKAVSRFVYHRTPKRRRNATLLAALVAGATLVTRAAVADVLTVAVFDFESKDEAVRDLGTKISALINAALSVEPQLITVERAELEKVLGEQELG